MIELSAILELDVYPVIFENGIDIILFPLIELSYIYVVEFI